MKNKNNIFIFIFLILLIVLLIYNISNINLYINKKYKIIVIIHGLTKLRSIKYTHKSIQENIINKLKE